MGSLVCWESRCIIGAFGALSTPLAGVMAEKLFGYKGGQHGAASHAGLHAQGPAAHDAAREAAQAKQNVNNARSLENGLLVVTVVPTVSHCGCLQHVDWAPLHT